MMIPLPEQNLFNKNECAWTTGTTKPFSNVWHMNTRVKPLVKSVHQNH